MKTINVRYEVHGSTWHIRRALQKLTQYSELSFDTETRGVYAKQERKEARQFLKTHTPGDYLHKLASVAAGNSGLSYPTLVEVTHFVFGLSRNYSVILVVDNPQVELMVWNWIAQYPGKFYIHNTLFDLKIMFSRIGKFPWDYEDTALWVKTLINNSDVWKAQIGLKELMGEYYDPAWALIDEYEPENLMEPKFLRYAGIDGAATYYLSELIREEVYDK